MRAYRSSSLSASSSSGKQVYYLHDWWLVKTDYPSSNSRRLSVAGINYEKSLGRRVFHSSAILKRHTAVTLETLDGVIIHISGTINRSRMCQNGFSQEVCNHFLIGFPYYWEQVNRWLNSSDGGVFQGLSNLTGVVLPEDSANAFPPGYIDGLPGALIREFSPSIIGESANCGLIESTFRDILQKYGNRANDGRCDENDPKVTGNSSDEGTPVKSKKSTAQRSYRGEDTLTVTGTKRKMLQKPTVKERHGVESNAMRKGPLTRSMSHLKTSRNKEGKGSVTGKVVSDATRITRRLTLRNRSVDFSL